MIGSDDDAELAPGTPDADEAAAGYGGTSSLLVHVADHKNIFCLWFCMFEASVGVSVLHRHIKLCTCFCGVHLVAAWV